MDKARHPGIMEFIFVEQGIVFELNDNTRTFKFLFENIIPAPKGGQIESFINRFLLGLFAVPMIKKVKKPNKTDESDDREADNPP